MSVEAWTELSLLGLVGFLLWALHGALVTLRKVERFQAASAALSAEPLRCDTCRWHHDGCCHSTPPVAGQSLAAQVPPDWFCAAHTAKGGGA